MALPYQGLAFEDDDLVFSSPPPFSSPDGACSDPGSECAGDGAGHGQSNVVADSGGTGDQAGDGGIPHPDMDMDELKFWIAEQELRTRTASLTAYEVEQLMGLPVTKSLTAAERANCMAQFGTTNAHGCAVAWAAELAPKVPAEYLVAGQALCIKSPLWTLLKGIHLAEQQWEKGRLNYTLHDCHCLPVTAFMMKGCPCHWESGDLLEDEFAPAFACPKCSVCVRCHKQLCCVCALLSCDSYAYHV